MPTKICRICFEEGTNLRDLGTDVHSAGFKLSECVPEINVYVVENPMICRPCLCMVEVAYKLRETCLENEKKFNLNFNRNDFVLIKKVPEIKSESSADDQQANKDVSMVYNDYFDGNGLLPIDLQHTVKTEENDPDFIQVPFGSSGETRINEAPQLIKTEVFDPEESLLEISKEFIVAGNDKSYVPRTDRASLSEYSCNLCDRSFAGLRCLKIHIGKMHCSVSTKKLKFGCETCRKKFTTKCGAAIHAKSCKNIKRLKNIYIDNLGNESQIRARADDVIPKNPSK